VNRRERRAAEAEAKGRAPAKSTAATAQPKENQKIKTSTNKDKSPAQSKPKPAQNHSTTLSKKKTKVSDHHDPHWYKRPSFLVNLFLGALSFALSALILPPDMGFTINNPYDSTRPLTVQFVVTNNGIYPLWHVSGEMALCEIDTSFKLVGDCDHFGSAGFMTPPWQNHTLQVGESFSFSPSDIFGTSNGPPGTAPVKVPGTVTAANIGARVTFYPWFLPIKFTRTFRVVAQTEQNGTVQWRVEPLN
jgi:hypothetical protein